MVKRLLTIIVFLNLFSQTEVIRSEQIEAFGLKRLSDILYLSSNFQKSSIDGFNFRLNAFSNNEDKIDFFIDGVAYDISNLTNQDIHKLPLSIHEIDEIIISSVPSIINGQIAANGSIHIKRKKVRNNIRIRAALYNETEDPGPYRYTKYSSPNVDHHGPDLFSSVSYKLDSFSLDIANKFLDHRPLDERITLMRERVKQMKDWPQIKQFNSYGNLIYHFTNHQIHFLAQNIQQNDFYYYPALKNELSLKYRIQRFALNSNHQFSDNFRLRTSIKLIDNKTKNDKSYEDYLDHDSKRFSMYLNSEYRFDDMYISLGIDYYSNNIVHDYKIKKNIENFNYLSSFSYNQQDFAYKITSNFSKRFTKIATEISYSDYFLRLNVNNYDAYYNLFEDQIKMSDSNFYHFEKNKKFTKHIHMNVSKEFAFKRKIKLSTMLFYNNLNQKLYLSYKDPNVESNVIKTIFSERQFFNTRNYGLESSLSYQSSNLFSKVSINYKDQSLSHYNAQANFEIKALNSYSPYKDLSLWSIIHLKSKRDYIVQEISSQYIFDLGVRKRFWNNKIDLDVALRNITDENVIDELNGRNINLSFEMQIQVNFDY